MTSTILPDGREKVWILEMNSNPLAGEQKKNKDGKKTYKFRGLCAEFNDDLNENNRMYDKDNYKNKANELLPKIEKRSLLGELDHNENFLVSMKNASHVITGLVDKGDTFEIEIELIPGHTQGDNAIALAEAGVPLHISSRASGYIDRNGNVTLEKIYTYDLVSEPGFKNAELMPVNESVQLQPDGKFRKFKNSNIRIYKYTDPEHKGNTSGEKSKINKPNTVTMDKAEIQSIVRTEMAKLMKKSGVRAINESLQVPNKLKYNGISVEMLSKIPQANDVITADSMEFTVKRVENIDESKDNSPLFKLRGTYAYTLALEGVDGVTKTGYITKTGEFHIADEGASVSSIKESVVDAKINKVFEAFEAKINELIDAVNATKAEQKMATGYVDSLSKLVETAVNEHDNMVKFVNSLADYTDNSAHVINKLIENTDAATKRLNLVTESLNATQEYVNEHAAHTDAIVVTLNKVIDHSDRATKHLNMLHKHSDQVTAMVNVHESKINKGVRQVAPAAPIKRAVTSVNESKQTGNKPVVNIKGGKDILSTTKKILAKVNSNKTEETRLVLEAKYPFVKSFTEDELKEFRTLSTAKKEMVVGKLGVNARKANVMEAIRHAAKQHDGLEFIDMMPAEKKAAWAQLPMQRKQNIIALFQSKNLRTKTAIVEFWDNLDLKPTKTTGLVRRINESVEHTQLSKSAMGYSDDDMTAALGL